MPFAWATNVVVDRLLSRFKLAFMLNSGHLFLQQSASLTHLSIVIALGLMNFIEDGSSPQCQS